MRRFTSSRRGFVRALTALSVAAFSVPFAITALTVADCYVAADPVQCCTYLGVSPSPINI